MYVIRVIKSATMIGLGIWDISVEKQEGKRPSARPRHTLEDDIKNNVKET
jgi:hypothetical protein